MKYPRQIEQKRRKNNMPFSKAQQSAIDTRNKNILVSASAGSGKTSVLVERLSKLVLEDKMSIDSILAMTFTKDAAAEMKSRLMSKLQEQPQTPYVQSQLALLETASICTIDSFCLDIVKQYYYALNISYKMANTNGSGSLCNELFLNAYQKACESLDEHEFTQLKLFFFAYGKDESDIQKSISDFIKIADSKPNPEEWILDQTKSEISEEIKTWFFTYFKDNIEALIDMCEETMDHEELYDAFQVKKEKLEKCLEYIQEENYEYLKKQFEIYLTSTEKFPASIDGNKVNKAQNEFKGYEENIYTVLFDMDTFKKIHQTNQSRINTFCTLSLQTMKIFADEKKKYEVIDFSDMEHFAYKLLCQPMIQEEIRNKYQAILVDEFQDTNDLQESIIKCFARKNNVFRVGDVKQSIYGFRQAKPEIMKGHIQNQDENSTLIILDENYRSNESIIAFNNDFYQKIMNTNFLGENFHKEDYANVGTKGQKECTQYPVRFLYSEYEKYTSRSTYKKNNADLIAHDIMEKHTQGIAYKDICILTRDHDSQKEIKDALEAYDIPVLALLDKGFYTNHAIQIVMTTLLSFDNPHNDIALMASLCSPIGNVSYEDIGKACKGKEKGQSLYQTIKGEDFMEDWLSLRKYKNQPITTLIKQIYNHNDFYYSFTTKQDKTNLDQFLQKACDYIDCDLNTFLTYIQNESEHDSVGEAQSFGVNDDVVNIKTIHQSKGLQFPIVYVLSSDVHKDRDKSSCLLMDSTLGLSFNGLTSDFKIKRPSLQQLAIKTKKFHDELEEEMRIFYVATTRAKQELVIVDSIESLELFKKPLCARTFMQRKIYTGWLLNTYANDPYSLLVFDKKIGLYDRPEKDNHDKEIEKHELYSQEIHEIKSQTASLAKIKLGWPEISLKKKTNTIRGTLFHEIAAQCSYPYKEEEIVTFAKERYYDLSKTDINQLLSLNEDTDYQDFMKEKHEFECSYIVKEDDTIVHGFMDLVVWKQDCIYILDFKTDTVEDSSELIKRYKVQLETYKKALSSIEDKPIYTVIYSFHLKQMITL